MGIFLFGISLILWNCEKQENFTTQQKQTTLENIQSKFNPADFQKTIPYDFTIDWNNTNKLYSEELKTYYYEFPIIYKTPLNPIAINKKKKAGNYYTTYKIFVTKDLDQGFSFYALKAYEKIAKTGNPITDVSFNNH